MKQAQEKINKHVRAYQRFQKAPQSLGANEDDLNRYKHLTPEDLKLSRDVLETNCFNQRNDCLSWIWTTGLGSMEQDSEWMDECMLKI